MSLRVSGQLDTLVNAIYELMKDPIDVANMNRAQMEAAAKARMKAHLDKICEYLITYMEIKGIKVEETFAAGLGSNHVPPSATDLVAGVYPATGSVIGVQSNDGTGRIA